MNGMNSPSHTRGLKGKHRKAGRGPLSSAPVHCQDLPPSGPETPAAARVQTRPAPKQLHVRQSRALRQSAPLCFRYQCALGCHGPHAVPPLLPHAAVTAVRALALHRAHGADRCHAPGLALAAGRRAPAQGPGHIAVC